MHTLRALLAGVFLIASIGCLALGLDARHSMNEEIVTVDEDGEEWVDELDDEDKLALADDALDYWLGSAVAALLAFLLALSSVEPYYQSRVDRRLDQLAARIDDLSAPPAPPPEETLGPQRPSRISLEDLLRDLSHDSLRVRVDAARRLRELGPEAEDAREALLTTLRETNGDLTLLRPVILALLETSCEPDLIVAELIARLDSPDPRAREWAAYMLGGIGPRAEAAVPKLVELIPDPIAGRATVEALRKIGGPEAKHALRGVISTGDRRGGRSPA